MKNFYKLIAAIFFAVVLIVPAFNVNAISGACSGHGGVNCKAGADWWDGSVICNDGWRKSTVKYKTMAMCAPPVAPKKAVVPPVTVTPKKVTPPVVVPKKVTPPVVAPKKTCCKVCTAGKACGNSCISARYTCHQAPGCACNAY